VDAGRKDLRILSDQDPGYNPRGDQWANGTDPAAELRRLMKVRWAALDRFGETAIRRNMPLALMEEALVPVFLHHRYQVEAAASALGGQYSACVLPPSLHVAADRVRDLHEIALACPRALGSRPG
jgi:hypothetical protein